jgi:tRNA-2-methylthio-N6-dimethylallyladenosine synthase
MEGCNRHCTYCVVPKTRGPEISRPMKEILAECQILAEQGVKEITLLGQNVSNYLDNTVSEPNNDLAALLRDVAKISPLARIRFTTSHPHGISAALLSVLATEKKIAGHVHIPVQSGSNRILQAMHRGYNIRLYEEKIAALRNARKDISISTDFIVGFPGETENDFHDTLDLVRRVHFDNSFSFIYSARKDTIAANLPDLTPPQEKELRLIQLQQLLKAETLHISQGMCGSYVDAMITAKTMTNHNAVHGRTENNRNVAIHLFPQQPIPQIGDIVKVKITKAQGNNLLAEYYR